MIICICHRVSDRDIAREVARGCPSFEALQDATRVATGCGACGEFAKEAFAAHRSGAGCAQLRHPCGAPSTPGQATQSGQAGSPNRPAPTPAAALV